MLGEFVMFVISPWRMLILIISLSILYSSSVTQICELSNYDKGICDKTTRINKSTFIVYDTTIQILKLLYKSSWDVAEILK